MDENKYLVLNKMQKKILYIFLFTVVFFAIPLMMAGYFNYAINRPSQIFKEVNYNLKKDQSLPELSKDLADLGVVNSENLFNIYVRLTRSFPYFREGIYTFKSGSSLVEVVEQLKEGTNGIAITFVEGKRLEEFGIHASKILPSFNYEDFIRKTRGLEGKLFPDTYFFYLSATEDDVIRVMKDNFEKKINQVREKDFYQNSTLSDDEIFTIASLLEKESRSPEERQIIAGIIMKRLMTGEILGIDASNQYVSITYDLCMSRGESICPTYEEALKLDWWKDSLTKADLQIDSPYNLRINRGLPPTPISSFGMSSLEAALNPIFTDYLYYLHDRNGKVVFSKTLEEHNFNVSKYLSN